MFLPICGAFGSLVSFFMFFGLLAYGIFLLVVVIKGHGNSGLERLFDQSTTSIDQRGPYWGSDSMGRVSNENAIDDDGWFSGPMRPVSDEKIPVPVRRSFQDATHSVQQ